MKKCINISIAYAVSAMAGGVFYREFTKLNGFSGVTALGKLHVHLFMLGMAVFLLAALFADRLPVVKQKAFKVFLVTYNIGVPLTAVMLIVRGIFQVLGIDLSPMTDSMISGIAGLGHILTGIGLISLLLAIRKGAKNKG